MIPSRLLETSGGKVSSLLPRLKAKACFGVAFPRPECPRVPTERTYKLARSSGGNAGGWHGPPQSLPERREGGSHEPP